MLYGRQESHDELEELIESGELNEEDVGDPIELKQLTIEMHSNDLRLLAKFLNEMADLMENDKFKHTHYHLGFEEKEWNTKHPDIDICVCYPNLNWDDLRLEE